MMEIAFHMVGGEIITCDADDSFISSLRKMLNNGCADRYNTISAGKVTIIMNHVTALEVIE